MRTIAITIVLLAFGAASADAAIVYVKEADAAKPVIYVARDDGSKPRRLGIGRAPKISPDGKWVAYITVPESDRQSLVLKRLRSGSERLVMRASAIESLRFSSDSKRIAAVSNNNRLHVYAISADRLRTLARGALRGYSFSPDAREIVFGRAQEKDPVSASDLYRVTVAGGEPERITSLRNAIYPVWGPDEIYFDRFDARTGGPPAYNLWAVSPEDGQQLRRLTKLDIPQQSNGLVPLEVSEDGRNMLAVFLGTNVQVGFTVATEDGKTRALSQNFASGLVGFGLSRNGRRILAHTGGSDRRNRHDVVWIPFKGGEPRTIVSDAAFPDWTR